MKEPIQEKSRLLALGTTVVVGSQDPMSCLVTAGHIPVKKDLHVLHAEGDFSEVIIWRSTASAT